MKAKIGGMDADKWASMMSGSVPDSYIARAEVIKAFHAQFRRPNIFESLKDGLEKSWMAAARPRDWSDADRDREFLEYQFAWNWVNSGMVTYKLSHSISALLSVTKAPSLSSEYLPHRTFLIEVPKEYFPIPGSLHKPTRWIGVQNTTAVQYSHKSGQQDEPVQCTVVMFVADSDMLADFCFIPDSVSITEDDPNMAKWDSAFNYGGLSRVGIRLASNVAAYVTQHKECVRSDRPGLGRKPKKGLFRVSAPDDIVVDREFRESAARLISAGDFAGVRRALSHVVRGHWRNQPVGEGRKERRLTWVRPHKRGDESLGRVVQRIERITAHV